ncbi:MAG: hypothetical protein PUH70_14180 [Clostridiales bacterium]|nr:hypothetical protein [Clostridiales bacterium]MDY5513866.1 hypothetical protein [Candidatus Ventricola sp.]
MLISDKQELRRCVKQAVRRAQVSETMLCFDVQQGEMGVEPLMAVLRQGQGTPFGEDGAAVYAALDALGLPIRDPAGAISMQQSYERNAWLREVLDVMRAQRVLVAVPLERAQEFLPSDDRLAALPVIDSACFVPGRYGIDYRAVAARIAEAAHACGARDLLVRDVPEDALRYAVLPACEDARCVLHAALEGEAQVRAFAALLDEFSGVRAIASAEGEAETTLIALAAQRPRLLVRLTDMSHLPLALEALGARFLPYASGAPLPELMLGRWIGARERLWPLMADAYLPLARAGYPLDSQRIERDVASLLTENLRALYA